jgi:hypothetical protein
MTKNKGLLALSNATKDSLIVALLIERVNDMRHAGLTDRAIARKLNLPRWVIRGVK